MPSMRLTGTTLVGSKHEELTGQPVWPLASIRSGEFRSITVVLSDNYTSPINDNYTSPS